MSSVRLTDHVGVCGLILDEQGTGGPEVRP